MDSEKETQPIVEEKEPDTAQEQTPTESIKEQTPTEQTLTDKQILETLKEVTEINARLKAELDAQKQNVKELKQEIDKSKPLRITVDEFIGTVDYAQQMKETIKQERKVEEDYARIKYNELREGFSSI